MSTANLVEVKPCPFCGSDEILVITESLVLPNGMDKSVADAVGEITLRYCQCESCRSRGPSIISQDEQVAITVWSIRSEE